MDAHLARKPLFSPECPLPALLKHPDLALPSAKQRPSPDVPAPPASEQPSVPLQAALGPSALPCLPSGEGTEARVTLFPGV